MENILINCLALSNIIMIFIIKEMLTSNKKKDEIIRLQDNWLKDNNMVKKY